ncbi:hypothetical protein ACFL3C_02795 [Patescibacteria group bacterium]
MNIKKLLQKGLVLLIIICFAAVSNTAFAQIKERKVDTGDLLYKFDTVDDKGNPTTSGNTTDYISALPSGSSEEVIANIIYFVLIVANILAFVSFIAAAVFMFMSQGSDEDLSNAKRIFMYTVFAMLVCASVLAFVTGITKLQLF